MTSEQKIDVFDKLEYGKNVISTKYFHFNESSVRAACIKLSQAAIMTRTKVSMLKIAKEYIEKAWKATSL
jgi:hypothetical protein